MPQEARPDADQATDEGDAASLPLHTQANIDQAVHMAILERLGDMGDAKVPDAIGELVERLVAREVAYRAAPAVGAVYAAIDAVMGEVTHIGKGGRTPEKAGGYAFRGIDQVVDALSVAFRRHRLAVQSEVRWQEFHTEGKMTDARVVMRYDLTSLEDGSTFRVEGLGEGRDSSDKGANKAMSMAKKDALCTAFLIPTGEPDHAELERPQYGDDEGDRRPSRPASSRSAPDQAPPRRYSPAEYAQAIGKVQDRDQLRRLGDHIAEAGSMDEVVEGSSLRQRLQATAATFDGGQR
jgi:hypothetical protein